MTDNPVTPQHLYYFGPGHKNTWDIYLRMASGPVDRFVGVVFDSECAEFVTDALNAYREKRHLSDVELAELFRRCPGAQRRDQ